MQKTKVNETKQRSLIKGLTFRIVEIVITTGAAWYFLKIPLEQGVGVATIGELTCFILFYTSERIWNRINWGREIKHE